METRGYLVWGRVQGVGFRWWVQETAIRLGLVGWVRNLADGAVEVHASGEADALAALEEALYAGPAGARVDEVKRVAADAGMPGDGFRITH